jgi:hypothetical protein
MYPIHHTQAQGEGGADRPRAFEWPSYLKLNVGKARQLLRGGPPTARRCRQAGIGQEIHGASGGDGCYSFRLYPSDVVAQ